MNKATLTSQKAYITYLVIALLLASVIAIRYFTSFATVQFSFNPSIGSITLLTDQKVTIQPTNHSPIRLKKGRYTVTSHGTHIATNSQSITIDGSQTTYPIRFRYTDDYLQKLYQTEQLPIYTALLLAYPQIKSDYTIQHDRLYGLGEWFGATLVYNHQNADNSDNLHVIMKKSSADNRWQLLSRPPRPIVSQPDYPSVPYDILKAINQAK